ncbi:DUF1329 domain-containing protein [Solimonas sp. K1W22B-7]|uniref:DUF1329 domain-containing protein n=1 Tax=Solimonas sp. K1W22B-7 TaxID=2303331 RepID=UPI000E32F60A|nr:DUF1329 domain-containing protein [Solimonas sp. K1W22B-7]AXQ28526.1 DUF1329 domain-containing protein [Solimonas sp. K1W22B-7]
MRIRKYDVDYGRRTLMKNAAIGLGAGVLLPLEKVFAAGGENIAKAYPDELLDIGMYTKGKLKAGDMVTASNVDAVKNLLDPITYEQIKNVGRKIKIRPTTTDMPKMFSHEFYTTTQKNLASGTKASWDSKGNVVTSAGKPWVGGLAFPSAKTGDEVQANLAMSWGRGDYCQYAVRDTVFNPDGKIAYDYDLLWAELQIQSRLDGTVFQNKADLLRMQTVLFTATQDVAGSSFLSTWYYDQSKFPDLYGYLPQFRRVRQFPTNQRFEPLIPGVSWFLSDAWAAGDPMRTWGEFKILARQPMLTPVNSNFVAGNNWMPGTHGGPNNDMWFDTEFELSPEVILLESKPTQYPRSPVGRRVSYIDARNQVAYGGIRYDRQDKPWLNFEAGFGQFVDGKKIIMGPDGKHPAWSWTYVVAYDIQSRRMDRIRHAAQCAGGYKSEFAADNEAVYKQFFTQQALQRLGQV